MAWLVIGLQFALCFVFRLPTWSDAAVDFSVTTKLLCFNFSFCASLNLFLNKNYTLSSTASNLLLALQLLERLLRSLRTVFQSISDFVVLLLFLLRSQSSPTAEFLSESRCGVHQRGIVLFAYNNLPRLGINLLRCLTNTICSTVICLFLLCGAVSENC